MKIFLFSKTFFYFSPKKGKRNFLEILKILFISRFFCKKREKERNKTLLFFILFHSFSFFFSFVCPAFPCFFQLLRLTPPASFPRRRRRLSPRSPLSGGRCNILFFFFFSFFLLLFFSFSFLFIFCSFHFFSFFFFFFIFLYFSFFF